MRSVAGELRARDSEDIGGVREVDTFHGAAAEGAFSF